MESSAPSISALLHQMGVLPSHSELIFTVLYFTLLLLTLASYHSCSTKWYLKRMRSLYGPDWERRSPVHGLRAIALSPSSQVSRHGPALPTLAEGEDADADAGAEHRSAEDASAIGAALPPEEGAAAQEHGIAKSGVVYPEKTASRSEGESDSGRGSGILLRKAVGMVIAIPLGLAGGLVGGVLGAQRGVGGIIAGAALGTAAGALYPFHLLGITFQKRHQHHAD